MININKLKAISNNSPVESDMDFGSIIENSETEEIFKTNMRKSKMIFGASYNQALGPLFMKIYNKEEIVKKRIENHISEKFPSITDNVRNTYFGEKTNSGLEFVLLHFGIPKDICSDFLNYTNELILKEVRYYLEIDEFSTLMYFYNHYK